MINDVKNERMQVESDIIAGPFLRLPLAQLASVREVLDRHGISYWVDSFAISLDHPVLDPAHWKAVVDQVAERLLTPFGLRSLAPGHPDYKANYSGDLRSRDAAYHQGTVWGWLLGPFVLAHLRVYRDRKAAAAFLEPLGRQISSHGLGTLSEIFDGDAPFTPRGCIAQAWTVGEVLRAWRAISPSLLGPINPV